MALAEYLPACGKNNPGNVSELYLVEAAKITSVTETADEISAVTMVDTNKFVRVKADFDSVQYTAEGTYKTSGAETQSLIARFSHPTNATEIFLNNLKGAVACGVVAIFVDNNRVAKAFGISAIAKEGKTRPVNQLDLSYDSGVLPTDEDTQAYTLTLVRLGTFGPVPFDTTLTGAIINGTADFIDWGA